MIGPLSKRSVKETAFLPDMEPGRGVSKPWTGLEKALMKSFYAGGSIGHDLYVLHVLRLVNDIALIVNLAITYADRLRVARDFQTAAMIPVQPNEN